MNVNVCHDNGVARFLIVVVPLVAHFWPAVAIGEELAAKGQDVAWCGPEGDLRPLLGPDALIYSTGKRSYREFHEVGIAAVRELWDEYVIPFNRFISGPVDRAMADYQPDVVLADQYALAGALAAVKHGVRWATLCPGPLELTPPTCDPGLRELVASKLAQARETLGGPGEDWLDPRFSPHLVIATTIPALTGTVPMPDHFALIGPAFGPRRTDPSFRWDWWDADRKHVLVTAGTMSAHLVGSYLARMVEALEPMASGVQVVLNAAKDAVADPPPHILVAPQVPMLDLLPCLDAVICHAGQCTVNEALAHGVPVVVAPIRLGELAVAEQVTRVGAGMSVSFSQASPEQLTTAVTAVLDQPGYRAQARRLSEEISAAGGAGRAAARLVALAADDHPECTDGR